MDVPLLNDLRIQILPTIEHLARARKHQFAAFIASEEILVVWDDEAMHLIQRAKMIENELMQIVWQAEIGLDQGTGVDEKAKGAQAPTREIDAESGVLFSEKRATHLQQTVIVAISLALMITTLGAGYRNMMFSFAMDHGISHFLFALATPVQIFFSMFFCQIIITCLFQLVGPVGQLAVNSRSYSALPPRRLTTDTLPHVTIQCPVYKEGLRGVIQPTVRSLKQAISTYELQGGSANIWINDDGMRMLPPHVQQERMDFYTDNNIGWTARPAGGDNGFIRAGKFKKASNMNFGLMVSNRVEEKLAQVERHDNWTSDDESHEYERCLKEVVSSDDRIWAEGNIRIGDYILLIDSDTRVPVDCLLDACSEMEQCPQVGILQFSSGVMQVTHDYFENGITFFTNLIYTAIGYAVASGDIAPFVGHNAMLRWTAIQQVSYEDAQGNEKFWSEAHVSEDFEMALNMQIEGYLVRFAAWANGGFKEGVSLTVYDELSRWQKYAYGCNELLLNPIRTWPWRGPFTKLFRKFIFSCIKFPSKITVITYVGTYYAIGSVWLLTIGNYFAIGWYNGYLDKYYIDSWRVWLSVILVFSISGNVATAMLRYRTGVKSFASSLIENFKWVIMFMVFFSGVSLHLSAALLAHLFEIDMKWGATAKELESTNFFREVPKVLKQFWITFLISFLLIAGMIVLATGLGGLLPYTWLITQFIAIFPLAMLASGHILLPIALNPGLMTFTF